MARISLDEIELHVETRGAGLPLLLVHGFPLDHSMWRGQLDALADTCRVVAPDLRGFGRSSVTRGTVSMEQFADDLAGLLDAAGIDEPVALCGLSMGGYVGWQFWRRHAQRLRCLILCDTRAAADTAEAARGRLEAAEKVVAEGSTAVIETMLPKLFAPRTAQQDPQLIEQTRRVISATAVEGIAAALRGMAARPDMSGELSRINVPALLICGQHDVISPVAEMRGIAEALPQARFVEIADAGHMAPLEQPQAVNSAIREFLETV